MGSEDGRRHIGVFPNLDKPASAELCIDLIKWLEAREISAYVLPCVAQVLRLPGKGLAKEEWARRLDFMIVLGGDGTLLGAARLFGAQGIPMLGVNLGHFGFLTELEIDSLFESLPDFIGGRFYRDERMLLWARVFRQGEPVFDSLAMNEACVVKGPYGRMATLSLSVSGKYVDTYSADGLIVATPTGSTAYSLSAGGPIVAPQIAALLVTPVCPHTLYSRSIVVPSGESCEIEVCEPSTSTMLSIDGQEFFNLARNDRIVVTTAAQRVVLLRHEGWSFYDILRRKMKEGADRLPR